MNFLASPWVFAAGAIATSIPLALHFFYRARYRPVPWAAMKFLKLSIEQTSRRLRFQELVLLALRMLVFLLLGFAMWRPSCSSFHSGSGRGGTVDAILVFDTSYSMAGIEADKTRLDRAKEAALKVIDNLPSNSTVQVVASSNHATHLGPQSPTNLDQARGLVKNIKTGGESTDFYPGFAEAVECFNRTSGGAKEVYLFSDMQRTGWENQSGKLRDLCESVRSQATLYLIRCSESTIKNATIFGILPQGEIVHTGERIPFTVMLRNTGMGELGTFKVSLEVDGNEKDRDDQVVASLAPGETRAVTVTAKLPAEGWHRLTARLRPGSSEGRADDLEPDNQYDRILYVRKQVRILVVDGSPNAKEPEKAASFNIGNALLPIDESQKAAYFIQAAVVSAPEAYPALLADRDIVILANVRLKQDREDINRPISNDLAKSLGDFVRDGNGLIITSGSNVVPADYNETFYKKLGLLPFKLGSVTEGDKFQLVPNRDSVDPQSYLGAYQNKKGILELLADVEKPTSKFISLDESSTDAGHGSVLLRFFDGSAMITARRVGEGDVFFITTSADQSWSDFPKNRVFPILFRGMIAFIAQRSGNPFNRVAGEEIRYTPSAFTRPNTLDPAKQYYLIKPSHEEVRLGKPQESPETKKLQLASSDTSEVGEYRIVPERDKDAPGVRFVVTADPREAENLDAMDDAAIDSLLGFQPVHLATGIDGSSFTGTERTKNELTTYFLMALLFLAIGEMVWAWFCGRSW